MIRLTDNRPIGFIDSGVGGLTVVKEALKQLPNENILFVGDTARCPYGPRPMEQVIQYTWEMTDYLVERIKMLVIACNTATAGCFRRNQSCSFYSSHRCDPSRYKSGSKNTK